MSDDIIGPNSCHWCGGEYGEHSPECRMADVDDHRREIDRQLKLGKAIGEEVTMIDVICENRKLRGEVFALREAIKKAYHELLSAGIEFVHQNYGLADRHVGKAKTALRDVPSKNLPDEPAIVESYVVGASGTMRVYSGGKTEADNAMLADRLSGCELERDELGAQLEALKRRDSESERAAGVALKPLTTEKETNVGISDSREKPL